MRSALVFHLKSKVFNNVERPLKAQASIQAQRLSTMVGKLKAQLGRSSVCGGFGKLYVNVCHENAVTNLCWREHVSACSCRIW